MATIPQRIGAMQPERRRRGLYDTSCHLTLKTKVLKWLEKNPAGKLWTEGEY